MGRLELYVLLAPQLAQFTWRQTVDINQSALSGSAATEISSPAGRRLRMTALIVLASLACSGTTSCSPGEVVVSTTAIAAVLVGTTADTIAVESQRHTIKGCVFSDAEGLKLRTSDSKIYSLEGDVAALKVGDRVKFHGSKVKKAKGNDTGREVFVVEKLGKDYGQCPVALASSTTPR
jgi:hypothetical protein